MGPDEAHRTKMATTDHTATSAHSSGDWHTQLLEVCRRLDERVIAVRREFHRHPEVSFQEHQTSMKLYQWLSDAGLEVQLGPDGCGLIADIASSPAAIGRGRFAIRADLDALRIDDCKDVEYRSQVPGVMHACGHDAHSAMLLGTMLALRELRDAGCIPFDWNCRAIFQPAEETSSGARQMIQVGALDGVKAIIALHVDPSRDVGRIGLRRGVLTSNCDEVHVTIHGRGGHAARPHEAHDPVAAAAQLVNALYTYIPRLTNSQDAVVLTICQVEAGDNANVIPETVCLKGTLRTLDADIRKGTIKHIAQIARGVAEITQTQIDVGYGISAPSVFNNPEIIELLRDAAAEVCGEASVEWIARPSMGSEDFALYVQQVPGALARLGCRSARVGGRPLHSPDFDIDERALAVGCRLMARTALQWWERRNA